MLARENDRLHARRRTGLAHRLRHLRDDESGIAILTAVVIVTIGLAVGGVAAVTATNAMSGSARDESSKDALAAADAGAQIALMRQNQVAVDDLLNLPCVAVIAGSLRMGPVGTGDWCGEMSGTVGDAEYTYRVSPPDVITDPLLSEFEVVSTGTSNGVTRRIHVTAESPRATAIFADSTVVGDEGIKLDSNSQIHGNAATNGDIVLNSNADLCGVAQTGDGGPPIGDGSHGGRDCAQTSYATAEGTVNLPPIDQGDVANQNDNWRIDPDDPLAPDTISGNGDVSFVDRSLTLDSNSAITLGGGDYSFCSLELKSNTELIVAAGAEVRIFFDTPEYCPGLGDGPQILLDSNSRLTTTDGSPASLQLLVVGDPDSTSDGVVLNSNSKTTMPVILYAPNSEIEMKSNSSLLGAVAGQSVHLDSNSVVSSHADSNALALPLPLSYRQTQFVECVSTEAPVTAPSSNC